MGLSTNFHRPFGRTALKNKNIRCRHGKGYSAEEMENVSAGTHGMCDCCGEIFERRGHRSRSIVCGKSDCKLFLAVKGKRERMIKAKHKGADDEIDAEIDAWFAD